MINLTNKAKRIKERLNRERFKGEKVRARFCGLTSQDEDDLVRSGEKTKEEARQWRRDYAIIQVDVDLFKYNLNRIESEYVYLEVDEEGFYDDLIKWLQQQVGSDVKIHYHSGTKEIEFERKQK